LREEFHLKEEEIRRALPLVQKKFNLAELAVISTCNRFEMIAVTHAPSTPSEIMHDVWLAIHEVAREIPRVSRDQVRGSTYALSDRDAAHHLFNVAASLDSMVVGETQITGQFKDAFTLASEVGTAGPTLARLAQEASATARKVRAQTEIGRKPVSISSAAIDLARKVFGNLSDQRFAIIGAGEMAGVAARHILASKPQSLVIVNRSMARAENLLQELGSGSAAPLDQLAAILYRCDIVISSTSAAGIVVEAELIRRVQAARRGKPLLLIDIALPRDIDPACGNVDDVFLFDIDDLQQVVGQNLQSREDAASGAHGIVAEGVSTFERWLGSSAVKPVLASFRSWVDSVVDREKEKSFGKDVLRGLDERQSAAIDALLDAVKNRIAAEVAMGAKALTEAGRGEEAADMLTRLFPSAGKKTEPDNHPESHPKSQKEPS
jgi:glutamyl-tRNA reductase